MLTFLSNSLNFPPFLFKASTSPNSLLKIYWSNTTWLEPLNNWTSIIKVFLLLFPRCGFCTLANISILRKTITVFPVYITWNFQLRSVVISNFCSDIADVGVTINVKQGKFEFIAVFCLVSSHFAFLEFSQICQQSTTMMCFIEDWKTFIVIKKRGIKFWSVLLHYAFILINMVFHT